MVNTTSAVTGLTCAMCLAELLEHVRSLDEVEQAAADLIVGRSTVVVVVSERGVSAAKIRAAVQEAGFSLALGKTLRAPHRGPAHFLAEAMADTSRGRSVWTAGVRARG